jgi:hypothetical protein
MPEVDPETLELPTQGRVRATQGRVRDFVPFLVDHRPACLRTAL